MTASGSVASAFASSGQAALESLDSNVPVADKPSHMLFRGRDVSYLAPPRLRFVRRFPSYYGRVRLLGSVHHRLRLLTFPMRAGSGNAVPVKPETSQLLTRSLCT